MWVKKEQRHPKQLLFFGIQYVWADCMCACVGLTQVAVGKGFGEWP